MKLKKKVIGIGLGMVLTSGLILSIPRLNELTKVYANTGSQQVISKVKTETALEVALKEFFSLEDFNDKFSDFAEDESWIVPDMSSLGSEDGGKTHGWLISPSEEDFLQGEVLQEESQDYIEGARVADIRQALADRDIKENAAIRTALHDYASLEEFNTWFSPVGDTEMASYTPDELWMIPDLSDVGSNDSGKSHGWTSFRTKGEAQNSDITDMGTGKVVYTFKVSDGASARTIREALAERDKT